MRISGFRRDSEQMLLCLEVLDAPEWNAENLPIIANAMQPAPAHHGQDHGFWHAQAGGYLVRR